MASLAAISFAALLAISVTVPAQSFLTQEQVTAATLAVKSNPLPGSQEVTVSASASAQTSQQESYSAQTAAQIASSRYLGTASTFTNNPNGTIQWPFLVGVRLSDGFGWRDCSAGFYSCDHKGQDFLPGLGSPIQAIADGVVTVSTDNGGGYGVQINILHKINGQDVISLYAHMQYGSRLVQTGDHVKVGQIIGKVGSTGASTGPHLHLEIRPDGVPVDPFQWLKANAN